MGDKFKDKVVLVTGSGQGVGRAIALAFAEEGAKVVTNNRKPGGTRFVSMTEETYNALSPERRKEFDDQYSGITGDAETTAQTIRERGGEALPIYCDISKMDEAEKMVQQVVDTYGTIHILVNVAGGFGGGPIQDITEELWDRTNDIKPKGYFNVMKFVVPHMIKQKYGRIINCSSKAFLGDVTKHAQYCAANAGVVGLTRGAAVELFSEGITVNAFSPFARTRAAYEGAFARSQASNNTAIPGQKAPFASASAVPESESVPPFILYLASEEAAKVTGTMFSIAGNEIVMHKHPVADKIIFKPGTEYWTMDELLKEAPRTLFRGYMNILECQ